MKKTIIGIVIGVFLTLGLQSLRASYVQDLFVESFHDCTGGWRDEIDWNTETWSFTKTYWSCPNEEMTYF